MTEGVGKYSFFVRPRCFWQKISEVDRNVGSTICMPFTIILTEERDYIRLPLSLLPSTCMMINMRSKKKAMNGRWTPGHSAGRMFWLLLGRMSYESFTMCSNNNKSTGQRFRKSRSFAQNTLHYYPRCKHHMHNSATFLCQKALVRSHCILSFLKGDLSSCMGFFMFWATAGETL